MSIRRIFITTVAVMLTSAVFADSASVTSKKYVDDLMTGYQNKIPGAGTNKLMIYDSNESDGINQKAIVSSLGENTSATDVPNVGAVLNGLDGKQDIINGTAGYVMTGTGNAGSVGERAIYSASTNYSNALVTAEAVNSGVINAVNSSLILVDENGYPDDNGLLWEINTNLFAFNFLPAGYTQLAYLQGDGKTRIVPGVTISSNLMVDIKYEIITAGWLFGGTLGAEGRWGLTSGTNFYSGTTGVADTSSAINLDGINIGKFDYKTGAIVNGVNIPFNSVQNYGDVTKKAFYLFTADGTGVSTQEHKIYYTKIYDNDILVRDMIPVQKDSDGTLGMYDTVSGTFFQNQGAGNFTAGPSCISPNLFDINTLNVGTEPTNNVSYKSFAAANGTYTMSSPDFANSGTNNIFFLAGSVSYGASSTTNGVANGKPVTITVTNGYYTIGYRTGQTNPNNPKDFKWQIEKGSTATTYRPYGENICD